MGSKLSVQCQGAWEHLQRFMERSGAIYYKVLDVRDDPCPGKRGIFRAYRKDQETNQLAWAGKAGADEWCDWAFPIFDARRWAWAFEQINEGQPMDNPIFRRCYNEFTVRASERMHSEGFPDVGLCFGVGWPDWGHAKDFREAFEIINYWGPHEYAAPRLSIDAGRKRPWIGRYQETARELEAAGTRVPPIFIGEGPSIDFGVWTPENDPVTPEKGWQHKDNNPEWYANELMDVDRRIYMPDRRVQACFIYTAKPYPPWETFEVTEPLAFDYLVPHIRQYPPGVAPEMEPGAPDMINWIDKLPTHATKVFPFRNVNSICMTIVHHTGGNARAMQRAKEEPLRFTKSCARWHRSHYNRPGLLYHVVIPEDGRICQTQPMSLALTHHAGDPEVTNVSASVCLLGNKNAERPSDAQLESLGRLCKWWGWPVYLHSDIVPTSCPAGPRKWGKQFKKEMSA